MQSGSNDDNDYDYYHDDNDHNYQYDNNDHHDACSNYTMLPERGWSNRECQFYIFIYLQRVACHKNSGSGVQLERHLLDRWSAGRRSWRLLEGAPSRHKMQCIWIE